MNEIVFLSEVLQFIVPNLCLKNECHGITYVQYFIEPIECYMYYSILLTNYGELEYCDNVYKISLP